MATYELYECLSRDTNPQLVVEAPNGEQYGFHINHLIDEDISPDEFLAEVVDEIDIFMESHRPTSFKDYELVATLNVS